MRAFFPLIARRQASSRTHQKRKSQGKGALSAPDLTYAVVGPVELVFTLGLSESITSRVAMTEDFKNELFPKYEPYPVRTCSHCGDKPVRLRSMLDPVRGRTIQMFKCECGEQTWFENQNSASRAPPADE